MGLIRLRLNTLLITAGMKGKVNRAEARQSEGGLGLRRNFALILRRPAESFIILTST